MRKIINSLLGILCALLAYTPTMYSQDECCDVEPTNFTTTSQLANNINNGMEGIPARIGQTFMACEDGEIVSITISFNDLNEGDPNGKLILLEGEANASQNETVQMVVIPGEELTHTFVLEPPYTVEGGQKYTWLLEGDYLEIHIEANGGNPYAGGGAIQSSRTTPFETLDLNFSLTICPGIDGTEGSMPDENNNGIDDRLEELGIPTVSEWGLILLGLVLAIIGMVKIRQKEGVLG